MQKILNPDIYNRKECLEDITKIFYMNNFKQTAGLVLPSDMGFYLQDHTLHIKMSCKGVLKDMLENTSAFESWAICLKAKHPDLIQKVHVDWEPFDKDTLNPKERGHYNRFLYRLVKFTESFSWAGVNPTVDDSFYDELNDWVLNYPKAESTSSTNKNKNAEAHLERSLVVEMKNFFNVADHQLPVGLFYKEVSKETARTPGNNSQIDLWGIKGKEKSTLFIFELKNDVNTEAGILTELLFYTNVMKDFVDHKFSYPESFSREKKHFRSSDELHSYISGNKINSIQGILLADKLHSAITTEALKLLKSNKNGVSYRWITVEDFRSIIFNNEFGKLY